MSVEGPIEPPLRLNELADVDSPEVVKAALSRFRRRTIAWALWIAGAIVAALLLLPTYNRDRNDPRAIFIRSQGESMGVLIHQGLLQATVLNVVRLNKVQFGVHMVVIDTTLKPQQRLFTSSGINSRSSLPNGSFDFGSRPGEALECWFIGRAGHPQVVVPFAVISDITGAGELPALHFDLRALSVPTSLWR